MSIYHDRKRHNPEVHEWCYRMLNDPEEWEKWRFKDALKDYGNIIEEIQKTYEQTPKSDHYLRARILYGLRQAKTDLQETLDEYEDYLDYKNSTAISR